MILSKIIKIMVFCIFCMTENGFSSASSTFSLENDTGVSCYRVYLPHIQREVEDFRVRVTFHKTAKDEVWLTEHQSDINKIHLPLLYGVVSELNNIKFPDRQSWETDVVTLYVTATCCNFQKSAIFLNATTYKLKKVEPIRKIHIKFKSINSYDQSLNAELHINDRQLIVDKSLVRQQV